RVGERRSRCYPGPADPRNASSRRSVHYSAGSAVRFRVPLLCAQLRNSRGPGHGFYALLAGSLLVGCSKEKRASRPTTLESGRRIAGGAPWTSSQAQRESCVVSGRRAFYLIHSFVSAVRPYIYSKRCRQSQIFPDKFCQLRTTRLVVCGHMIP